MPATSPSDDMMISWSSEVPARIEVGVLFSSSGGSEIPLMMLVDYYLGLGDTMVLMLM